MVKPIFILSLPRSGSTLLQRLLLGSGQCATLGEPSLLLRFLGNDAAVTRKATYWEFLVTAAEQDMRDRWQGFDSAYYEGIRDLMNRIYLGLANGKPWFIDKTPRYTLIADEIIKVFPDAKFIVLWRHPLAVTASMAAGKNYWFPDEYAIDLYEGFERLADFSTKNKSRICEVRYEDLVDQPVNELKRIGDYLGWRDLPQVLEQSLTKSAGGSLGDHSGVNKYAALSADSKDKWLDSYSNWYRLSWARSYVSGRRADLMEELGYPLPEIFRKSGGSFFSGFKDSLLASRRSARRHKNPVWLKRFSREYRKNHGYDVAFR